MKQNEEAKYNISRGIMEVWLDPKLFHITTINSSQNKISIAVKKQSKSTFIQSQLSTSITINSYASFTHEY